MRNFLLCMAVLLISSCIDVQDFSTYWSQGSVDPTVIGKWDITEHTGKIGKEPSINIYQVTDAGGWYQIDVIQNGKKNETDDDLLIGKTLSVGKYKYFLYERKSQIEKSKGTMFRYDVKDNKFLIYELQPDAMVKLLKEKYPSVTNITKTDCTGRIFCFSSLEITKLDDAVFQFLSKVPDTPEFWGEPGPIPRAK